MKVIGSLRVVLFLLDEGTASREEVLTHLGADSPSLTKIYNSLKQRGLIETAYRLTPEGKEYAQELRKSLGLEK